jgi:hypothetical protein
MIMFVLLTFFRAGVTDIGAKLASSAGMVAFQLQ